MNELIQNIFTPAFLLKRTAYSMKRQNKSNNREYAKFKGNQTNTPEETEATYNVHS